MSNKVCVPNKTEDLNLSMFNMITGINESKTLTKHISCKCKCRFDERKCNSGQWWNNDKCQCECKNRNVCRKDYVWNPDTCNWANWKYLASILDGLLIIREEVIDADAEAKSTDEAKLYDQTNFNEKNITCKTRNFYIFFAFLLITIA